MSYQIVLLDLDHTLLDTDTSLELAFADAMTVVGGDGAAAYGVFDEINRALWKQVESQQLTPPQVHVARFEQLIDQLELQGSPQDMADAFAIGMGEHGELYDGARAMLDGLVDSVTLGLITNGLSGIQRRRLERLNLDRYFETVIISGEVGVAKPGSAIFDLAFDQLDSPQQADVLMVGDSLTSDIAGGRAAGIDTCWYNPHALSVTGDIAPTHTIASLTELPGVVSRGG